MKRLTGNRVIKGLIPLALATTVITFAVAPADGAAAGESHGNGVIGSGVRSASSSTDVPFTFSFDAAAAPASDGIYGTFSGSFPHDPYFRDGVSAPGSFATFSGMVSCLQINGETATIGGIITSGYGYDSITAGDGFSRHQIDLAGDWFITTARDPTGDRAADTVGYVDWGGSTYFTTAGYGYTSFTSMCNDPAADLGTSQFPLLTGELRIQR